LEKKKVLSKLSAIIPAQKATVIMGESGCGKTTLINIIMGLEKADCGDISGVPERISAVFQDDLLCDNFSAISNIRAVIGKKRSKEDIAASLKALGLTDADIFCPVRKLSGGMKRRVAIARAILSDSELIIMDEPFKGLDEETREATIDFVLQNTTHKKKTLIVITHSPDEVKLLSADSVINFEIFI
jgi:NitT/TauT family transport system ATP-binding protein